MTENIARPAVTAREADGGGDTSWAALAAWMDGRGLESGPIGHVVPLAGGTQNIVVRFERAGSVFVLRRPRTPLRKGGNETMAREARILAALAGSDVPHPALIAACADPDVLGTSFYLMAAVDGFHAPSGLSPAYRADAGLRHGIGLALAEGAAALGEIDYQAAGLDGFGKPDGFLERQAGRWQSQLDGYAEYDGWPGPDGLSGVAELGRWLQDNIPAESFRAGILHGDYSIANVLFCFDAPGLAAIVDWELATIGDPLLDLGWMLSVWPDADGDQPDAGLRVTPSDGLASEAEIVAAYRDRTTRNLAALDWYKVLACYKLGILLEGTYARAAAGHADQATGDRLHRTAVKLFARARRWASV